MPTAAPPAPTRPVLRGRDTELERIGQMLASVSAGHGQVIVVDGPAGAGRTRLLSEAAAMAGRNGLRVAAGRSPRPPAAMPLAPLLTALFEGDEPVIGGDALRDLSTRPDQRYRLVRELRNLIGHAARMQPLLITLDDLQWADAETLATLPAVSAGLADAGVGWLIATRSGEGSAELEVAIRGLELAGASRTTIVGLTESAVADLARDLLHGEPGAALSELVARAAGSPLLLTELLEGLDDEGLVSDVEGRVELLAAARLPRRLRDCVGRRVDRLEPEAGELLRLASVLGRFSIEEIAAMLGAPPGALLTRLRKAFRAGLLVDEGDAVAFREDLVREAVAAGLPDSLRRSLHRQAADVLIESGADPLVAANHLVAGAVRGDRLAAERLRHAAQDLAGRDPSAAADLGLRALEVAGEDDPSRGELVAEIVSALHAAMRADEAHAVAAATLDAGPPAEQEAAIRLSLAIPNLRSPQDRADDDRRALALDGISTGMRARHMSLQALNTALAGSVAEAEPLLAPAREAARECGDETASDAIAFAQVVLEESSGSYELALGLAAGGSAGDAHLVELRLLAATGRLGEALERSARAVARAQRDRRTWQQACLHGLRARLSLDAGALAEARVEADAARSLCAGAMGADVALQAALVVGRVALHTGDARPLRLSARCARDHVGDAAPVVRRDASWLLALAAFASDDARAAVAWLRDDELPYAIPSAELTHPPQVVRIALAAGDVGLAEAAVAIAQDRARRNPGNALHAAVLAHARGILGVDPAVLLDGVALLRDEGRPLMLASALEDSSRVLVATGRPDEAARCAGEALDLVEQVGASADARRVRRQLRSLGVHRGRAARGRPREGWESLTESELGVVSLVVAGHTNRQVATHLLVSPHTVNTHLRHAFAKLRVNSRVQLARVVLDRR